MHELIGILEADFNGKIIKSTGEFEGKDQSELNEIVKNFLYIFQDAIAIKSKSNSGNFIKIRMRNDNTHYEAAIGSTYIRVNKYNPE